MLYDSLIIKKILKFIIYSKMHLLAIKTIAESFFTFFELSYRLD
ncbi:hypothetical protein Belba_3693 [Belliella baltica DSM 15883]|uniref:Uncharacterized protein n=1 Tax=Belliella baltica (strain DSM 15883 / CIP 108006 / LMG 21964 / BA134) TaxID=866536 RepID=I3ZAB5_BELBD|nr:hypothetical protein Belba_3693 [Belliella baltica DSM 15883]